MKTDVEDDKLRVEAKIDLHPQPTLANLIAADNLRYAVCPIQQASDHKAGAKNGLDTAWSNEIS